MLIMLSGSIFARPTDIPWEPSPDGRYEVSVRYLPLSNGSGTDAKLFLRRTGTEQVTETIALDDVDAEDYRNGVSFEWSPDSRFLAVNTEVGQLRGFSIYRVVSGHLKVLQELPLSKKLQPEHSKSRGGPLFQEWMNSNCFTVFDSSSETEFTYRITKEGKLQAIGAKATNP